MNQQWPVRLALLALLGLAFLPAVAAQPSEPKSPAACEATADLPLSFVPNEGQWDPAVRFLARRGGMVARFQKDGLRLKLEKRAGEGRLHGVVIPFVFEGARKDVRLEGRDRKAGVFNFFQGSHPDRWRTRVPAFGKVVYRGLYAGVDVVFRQAEDRLEYDLLLAPGADLARVVVRVTGNEGIAIADDGTLVIRTALGPIHQKPPTTWVELATGGTRPVACRYRRIDDRRYGFVVPERDPGRPLVIDPGVDWSTFLGGSGADSAAAIGMHFGPSPWSPLDTPVIVGSTTSTDFPTTQGAFSRAYNGGASDAFVVKTDYFGSRLVYATYLGGSANDVATGVVVDANGVATVVGYTNSINFPTTKGAYSNTLAGAGDVFVTRLGASGSVLGYSTYIGGKASDNPHAVGALPTGDVFVAGETQSSDFPTTAGAFDTTHNGLVDGFVTRLDAAGAKLVASTFLGSPGSEYVWSVAVSPTLGDVTVAGEVDDKAFPVTSGAYDVTYNGGASDAFVTRLDSTLRTLRYSTFLGGANTDVARDVILDRNAEVAVVGGTTSVDFPVTTGAYDVTHNGGSDAFVTRLNAAGGKLVYSTYLGGAGPEEALAAGVNGSGAVTVAGTTVSTDFPVTKGCFQPKPGGSQDAFVCRFDPNATVLHYASYLGGSGSDILLDLELDSLNNAIVCGQTSSKDYPARHQSFDVTYNGNGDGFAARFDMLPAGVMKYGASTPACRGPIIIGVNRMAYPEPAPTTMFTVNCYNAPPKSVGLLLVGLAPHSGGLDILGIKLHVDPFYPTILHWVYSDTQGCHRWPVYIPPGVLGLHAFFQYVWANTPQCIPPGKAVSASNAMMVIVLPKP